MRVYKITTKDGKTRLGEDNETQWGEGVEHTAPGGQPGICGEGWLHAYCSPAMAALMNVVHARINDPICWECDADVIEDAKDKLLCTRIKTLHCVDLPELSLEQRVEIAIRAAMVIYDESAWLEWAQNWLAGIDRSAEMATRAGVQSAAWAAAYAAAAWAARAARAAVWMAEAMEARSAGSATWVAEAMEARSAWSAAWVAEMVADATLTDGMLDLGKIINDSGVPAAQKGVS